MSEKKFIDSRDQIALDLGGSTLILPLLNWLDEHPEAVPANEEHEEFVNDICELLPERYDDVAAEAIVLWAVRDLVARAEAKPTITESELDAARRDCWHYGNGYDFREFATTLGIEVVPDPKPTEAEKATNDLHDWGLTRTTALELGPWLAGQGWVKAPGGDET